MQTSTLRIPVLAALATVLATTPVLAQGKGHGNGNGRGNGHDRTEDVRRRDDDNRDRRRDDRVFSRRSERRVPPGWCRGVGNPHRTAANCGYNTDRIYRDRNGTWRDRYGNVLRRDGIYRDRSGVLRNRTGGILRTGSRTTTSSTYEARHRDFHRQLRARCEARARGASLIERLRISRQCDAEHDAWHRRVGRRHS